MNVSTLEGILIHTGVNDIDDMSGDQVCTKLFTIVNKIENKFPGIKIVVSEVTPRMDERDGEVITCNRLLNSYASGRENVFVAAHRNLRDERFFRDAKHIKEDKIAKFAANLKRALQEALGANKQQHNRSLYSGFSTSNKHLREESLKWGHQTPPQQQYSINAQRGEKQLDISKIIPGFQEKLVAVLTQSIGRMFGT